MAHDRTPKRRDSSRTATSADSKSIRYCVRHTPNASAPAVACAGRINRAARSSGAIVRCAGEPRASDGFAGCRLRTCAPCSTGNTIGTSHADLRRRSTPSLSKPRGAAMRLRQSSSDRDRVAPDRGGRSRTNRLDTPPSNRSCTCPQRRQAQASVLASTAEQNQHRSSFRRAPKDDTGTRFASDR